MQLFAPASAYGRPEDLKALVEAVPWRGLAVLLDVVYNHFGPEGNYLHVDRAATSSPSGITRRGARRSISTAPTQPAGARLHDRQRALLARGISFRRAAPRRGARDHRRQRARYPRPSSPPTVRRAHHRSRQSIWSSKTTTTRRAIWRRRDGRPVGYTRAMERRSAPRAACAGDRARPAAITAIMRSEPIAHARPRAGRAALPIRASPRPIAAASRAASPRAICRRPPSSSFLQNHDQIGNTPFGERIAADAPGGAGPRGGRDRAAVAADPALVHGRGMGERAGRSCSSAISRRSWPRRCGEGRRREFAQFPEFGEAAAQDRIPDPTAESELCGVAASTGRSAQRAAAPDAGSTATAGCCGCGATRSCRGSPAWRRAAQFRLLGPAALRVDWRLGDGARCCCSPISATTRCRSPSARPARSLLYCTSPEPPRERLAACAAPPSICCQPEAARDEPARCAAPRRRAARHRDPTMSMRSASGTRPTRRRCPG